MKRLLLLPILLIFFSCTVKEKEQKEDGVLTEIAYSDTQLTGIAISKDGRMFVNFPTWSDNIQMSVGEVIDNEVVPYPNEKWNSHQGKKHQFVCVQSVVVDDKDRLWVLDPANPKFEGVIEEKVRLYQFDLKSDKMVKEYSFPKEFIEKDSYLNDFRIDTDKEIVYITDSGIGGILVLNLKTGEVRKPLKDHFSVKAEADYLKFPNGVWNNKVNSDGIALSPDKSTLYYAALVGHTLYKIPTRALFQSDDEQVVSSMVETVCAIRATDGMMFDNNGNLYLGGLERNQICVLDNQGKYYPLVTDEKIKWADSFAKDAEGNMYFTTSQINTPEWDRGKFHVYRINVKPTEQLPKRRVLIALTNHGTLGDSTGDATGYYLSEVAHAYYAFTNAGYYVDFVSPMGGQSPVDGYDLTDPENKQFVEDKVAQQNINNALTPDQVNVIDYEAIYYAGGHGVMWDLPDAELLSELTSQLYDIGAVVGAVCHGPAGLVNIKLADGSYLVDGKKVNGFTNEEEKAINKEEIVPFLLEDKLKERGGIFEEGPKWESKVVVDKRLVTGQNPASAKGVAEAMIQLLQGN
ncbi:L-dopachrome tautomerase-related protein [Sediminitomix flava]|uniref:Putative intracellular protease/amidase n=1 Tax=Sediminitomix flava TaxID=379075 RepID=A0A315ZDS3_SEDFL|nr:L-dopachrome tautomerase-related protein [Sediminitomix flava]PWJ43691.1 putative intracellular protease/amidase [Sediminitomix flava]